MPKTAKRTASSRAGLQFPVGRTHRLLKEGAYTNRVSKGSAVALSAILEYLSAEMLELAGKCARDNQMKRINPRCVMLAVQNDEELHALYGNACIPNSGWAANIHSSLLPKKKKEKKAPGEKKKSSKKSKKSGKGKERMEVEVPKGG